MSVDLFCYALQKKEDAEAILKAMSGKHSDIFPKKFFISPVRDAGSLHSEIAMQHGRLVNSVFLVSLNEKTAANRVLEVANLVKNEFGSQKVLVLHTNEEPC